MNIDFELDKCISTPGHRKCLSLPQSELSLWIGKHWVSKSWESQKMWRDSMLNVMKSEIVIPRRIRWQNQANVLPILIIGLDWLSLNAVKVIHGRLIIILIKDVQVNSWQLVYENVPQHLATGYTKNKISEYFCQPSMLHQLKHDKRCYFKSTP